MTVVVMCLPSWPYAGGKWPVLASFAVFTATDLQGMFLDPLVLPSVSVSVASPAVAQTSLLESSLLSKARGENHTSCKAEALPLNCALFCNVRVFVIFSVFFAFFVSF